MGINTKTFSADHTLSAAAAFIDRAIGKKGDHEITAGDLEEAQALVEKKRAGEFVAELTPHQIDVIEKALPDLKKALGVADSAPKRALTPFATGVWTNAIADPKVRASATAISQALGNGDQLQLGRFLDARDVVNGAHPSGREERVAFAADKLKDAIAAGVVTKDAVEALDTFFLEKGDPGRILNHGPVKISGIAYNDVYRLPGPNDDADGDGGGDKKGKGGDFGAVIDGYEARFKNVKFDRVYIQGKDGELYVALHGAGRLKKVDEGYGVTMRDEANQSASGKVLRVVDIDNSIGEATWGLWLDGIVSGVESITAGFKKVTSETLEKAASNVADGALGGDKDAKEAREKKSDLKSVGVAVYAAATTGVAAFNLPGVLAVLLIGGGAITAGSLISLMRKSYDAAPLFQAMGVTVNQSDEVTL